MTSPYLFQRVRALARDEAGSTATGDVGPVEELGGLKAIYDAVDALADKIAQEAGRAGASYADLGTAWGITRQGARRRWPGIVPVREKPTPCEHCNGRGHT